MQQYDPEINPDYFCKLNPNHFCNEPQARTPTKLEAFRLEIQKLRLQLAEYQELVEEAVEEEELTTHKNNVGHYLILVEGDFVALNDELIEETPNTTDGDEREPEGSSMPNPNQEQGQSDFEVNSAEK